MSKTHEVSNGNLRVRNYQILGARVFDTFLIAANKPDHTADGVFLIFESLDVSD
jgi:hypothetical protein